MFIDRNSIPGQNSFSLANEKRFPSDEEVKNREFKTHDNSLPLFIDPMNVFHFDIGSLIPENERKEIMTIPTDVINSSNPHFIYIPSVSSNLVTGISTGIPYQSGVTPTFSPAQDETYVQPGINNLISTDSYWGDNELVCRNSNQWASIKYYYAVKSNIWTRYAKINIPENTFYSEGGPRNNGYTTIHDGISFKINTVVDQSSAFSSMTINNNAWKQGSIELTIRPTKDNCTILSGAQNMPTHFRKGQINNGDAMLDVNLPISDELNVLRNTLIDSEWEVDPTGETNALFATPNKHFSDASPLAKYMRLDIRDKKLVFEYEVPYGGNKKHIVLDTNTDIVDGNWHHIVINRTNEYMDKYPGVKTGGAGALEVWIDGELKAKSYEITFRDNMPTPQVLFNDESSVAWTYASYTADNTYTFNIEEQYRILNEQNYVGDISDFVFRQSYPLNPQEINLNKTYAFMDKGSTIIEPTVMLSNIEMTNTSISSNKKKALKLYWNNLLNKEKSLNGLELDNDTFDVYSYSVTHKNLLSSSQNLNLDKNYDETNRFFYKNVRVAVKDFIFTSAPQTLLRQTIASDFSKLVQNDSDDEELLSHSLVSGMEAPYITNMLIGGVQLNAGDRILLLGQQIKSQNGIWIYNGINKPFTRPDDVDISTLKNAHVYVEQGNYADTTWVQINEVTHIRNSKQQWIQVENDSYVSKINSVPLHTTPWQSVDGNERFIDVNSDIPEDFDLIVFMNYPTTKNEIIENVQTKSILDTDRYYQDFINSLKMAIEDGKSLYVSSPMLAQDLGIVSNYNFIDQLIDESGDAQAASISPFEFNEPAEYYFDTHRNMKYSVVAEIPGLTDKETYLMTDFVTYSPERIDSEYHIKYNYRQFGLQEGDEFYIPGLTTIPETMNSQLPGYSLNQRGLGSIIGFNKNDILLGTPVTQFSNNIYSGSTVVANPYDDFVTTIVVEYGNGKIFVNCVENGYAFSRSDYNKALIQNVIIGENSETVQTAAWQYSTKRLNKKNLYDSSENTNIIGQTDPTNGGGGPIIQSQSHCSNGMVRMNTTKGDLKFQSDLYPDYTEEIFETTEIPVLSMTWLGLQWLAE